MTTGVLLMYPFAIYFGLQYLSPATLSIFLLIMLGLRVTLMHTNLKKAPWILPATLLGVIAIFFSLLSNSTIGFKLYPLAINLSMFIVFFYSYWNPPTVIESLARLTDKSFPDEGISYTTKVTLVWCVFFVINGSISFYTAFYTSIETWMVYNGFISYIAMGMLMALEFIIRQKVKKSNNLKQNTVGKSSHE